MGRRPAASGRNSRCPSSPVPPADGSDFGSGSEEWEDEEGWSDGDEYDSEEEGEEYTDEEEQGPIGAQQAAAVLAAGPPPPLTDDGGSESDGGGVSDAETAESGGEGGPWADRHAAPSIDALDGHLPL